MWTVGQIERWAARRADRQTDGWMNRYSRKINLTK